MENKTKKKKEKKKKEKKEERRKKKKPGLAQGNMPRLMDQVLAASPLSGNQAAAREIECSLGQKESRVVTFFVFENIKELLQTFW